MCNRILLLVTGNSHEFDYHTDTSYPANLGTKIHMGIIFTTDKSSISSSSVKKKHDMCVFAQSKISCNDNGASKKICAKILC